MSTRTALSSLSVKILERKNNNLTATMLTDSGSWQGMITSGIAEDKALQCKPLAWIREQSMNGRCVESLANRFMRNIYNLFIISNCFPAGSIFFDWRKAVIEWHSTSVLMILIELCLLLSSIF